MDIDVEQESASPLLTREVAVTVALVVANVAVYVAMVAKGDRKSTRLNSSH